MAIDATGGKGPAAECYLSAYRGGVKPLLIVIDASLASAAAFEKAMWPAMAAWVRTMLDSPAGKIYARGPIASCT